MLIDRPYDLDMPAPIPQQHPHALHIQTNLNWADFSSSTHSHSPLDPYQSSSSSQLHQQHVGSGLQQHGYDYAPSSSSQSLTPFTSVSDYDFSGGSPTSPSASSASECLSVQAHTPREGSADICALAGTGPLHAGVVVGGGAADCYSFDVGVGALDGYYAAPQGQKMMHQHAMPPIDMEALNGALAPFMQG